MNTDLGSQLPLLASQQWHAAKKVAKKRKKIRGQKGG
jgi:hypothetical protein